MKWIGQHIVDFIARFRSDVYLEGLATTTEANVLVVDSNGKVSKNTSVGGDVTSVVAGAGMTGGGATGDVTLNVIAGTGIDVAADAVSVDVSDFMTNGANNRILTATGTDAINAEATLTYDGAGLLDLTNDTNAQLYLNTPHGTNTPTVKFSRTITGQDNDHVGTIDWYADNDNNDVINYGRLTTQILDASDGEEASQMKLSVAAFDGDLHAGLILNGDSGLDSTVNVAVGLGVGSTTTVSGNMSLQGTSITSVGNLDIVSTGNTINFDTDTLNVTSGTSLAPLVTLKSTVNNALASYLIFNKDRGATPADNDAIGTVLFQAEDSGQVLTTYGSIASTIIETDHGDEAGQIAITVANDGVLRNGITVKGDKGTATEVDVDIANGAASTTTIAGTLTMGSTAALTNAGLVAVTNQSSITGLGTISSGVWQGTAVASAYLDTDTAHLSGAQSFTGLKTFSAGIIPSFVKHSISGNGTAEYGTGAEILFGISAETTTAGAIYVLRSGTWTLIDADFPNRCRQLAAVAVGTDSGTDGMLIRGCVTLAAVYTAGTDAEGIRVFASTTAGQATLTAPSATGDTVRVLGYSLNAGDKKMFFNPDNTHVEIA